MIHTFHIPVLGLSFSVDTPVKVAKFGISYVACIVDDKLIERMRKFHSEERGEAYILIDAKEPNSRAKRFTAYLNLFSTTIKKVAEGPFTFNLSNLCPKTILE